MILSKVMAAKPLVQVGLLHRRWIHSTRSALSWRPSVALDDWVQRDARPISLRQLTFFGRTLTEERLINSANYVRTELPAR